ncbi:hypothetical protein D3C78_1257890 [compost metagenome]
MHAHLGQTLNVRNRTQIFGVHDVGAVLVFERRHVLARTFGLFNHKHAVGRCAHAQGRLNVFHRDWFVLMHNVADVVFFPFLDIVFPAAGVGAGALIRVTFVDVARQQATAGIGHAQRAVNEDFELHFRDLSTDFFDLFERQLARQDHARQAHLFPEFHRRPVHGVRLHG